MVSIRIIVLDMLCNLLTGLFFTIVDVVKIFSWYTYLRFSFNLLLACTLYSLPRHRGKIDYELK